MRVGVRWKAKFPSDYREGTIIKVMKLIIEEAEGMLMTLYSLYGSVKKKIILVFPDIKLCLKNHYFL
jgi:hypothetical protein